MASSGQHPIAGDCEVGEAFVVEKVSSKRGLGAEKKKKVSVVIEKGESRGISRAYARSISSFFAVELGKIFNLPIDKSVKQIDTDQWEGYLPLMKDWNIVQTKCDPGVNFNLMHRFIQQLKDGCVAFIVLLVKSISKLISTNIATGSIDMEHVIRYSRI
ncbi:MAG: hypothetical protein ACJA0X_000973 [Cyclobacteriaceae bacterium]|jgi:hypothetical protein